MLQSLHVHNFALLEDAHADFTSGFNVFTGETGAGKSILIDAFGIVLGGRASVDYVRSGTDGLWVQAVFDIAGQEDIKNILRQQGLEAEDDLFLKRQISAAGKSRALINGVQVPLTVLKQIGTKLVDIHGQHENQALLKVEAPLLVTDAFGGAALQKVLYNYKEKYAVYVAAKEHLEQLHKDNQEQDLLIDRYAWEINEITNANLVVGEEDSLEDEARLLQNSEKIIKAVNVAYNQLDEADAVLSRLATVSDELQYAARYDNRLSTFAEAVDSSWINLDDCRGELAAYLSRSDFNEEQERLDTIYRLQRKYGGSTQAVLEYLQVTEVKLEQLQNITDALDKAQKQFAASVAELNKAAAALTKERKQSSSVLSKKITIPITLMNVFLLFIKRELTDISSNARQEFISDKIPIWQHLLILSLHTFSMALSKTCQQQKRLYIIVKTKHFYHLLLCKQNFAVFFCRFNNLQIFHIHSYYFLSVPSLLYGFNHANYVE